MFKPSLEGPIASTLVKTSYSFQPHRIRVLPTFRDHSKSARLR